MSSAFETKQTAQAPDAFAPDGSVVRLLGASSRGSMAAGVGHSAVPGASAGEARLESKPRFRPYIPLRFPGR